MVPTPRHISEPLITLPGASLWVVSLKYQGSLMAAPRRSTLVDWMRSQVESVESGTGAG